MTVEYKTIIKVPVPMSYDDLYNALKQDIKEKTAGQKDLVYFFRFYVTKSEQKPLKWETLESVGFIKIEDLEGNFKWGKELAASYSKSCTGFKIVCIGVDMLNTNNPPVFVPDYSFEQWAPSQKVYINGPKKTKYNFLAKKGKQYV